MIKFKELEIDKDQIKNLYLDNAWYAYTNDFDKLLSGIEHSLDKIGAYDGDTLVGLIRTIGDASTIVYIQDILILDSYKRKGIGRTLLQMIFDKYPTVRQIVLMTDIEDTRSNTFYQKMGMIEFKDAHCVGYKLKR